MTDRELLEAAARAAGLTVRPDVWHDNNGLFVGNGDGDLTLWNPLTDDGDALRLAVKLKMSIDTALAQSMAMAWGGRDCVEKQAGDPYAATRRAIVRAAAEVQP